MKIRNQRKTLTKRLIKKFKDHFEITLPDGTKTIIDKSEKWILDVFPSWVRRKNHVGVGRTIETEYGTAWEEYYLHRLIVKAPANKQIDHIDRNSFNNKKSNLRLSDGWQNSANSIRRTRSNTGFRGVGDCKRNLKKRFRAYIGISRSGKAKTLGYFHTPEEAAKAYDEAAKETWGEFAILNFPIKR